MNQLSTFNFDTHAVRVVTGEDGEPLFVGKDVCETLGYADHTNAMKQHCRGVVKRHPIVDSLGRNQEVRVLTEADVLRLIVSSKLPAAEAFERWVFEEVLPSIRKTGAYVAPGAASVSAEVPPLNVNVLADAVDRGLMSKRSASGMIKAWVLAQHPAMAAMLAAQRATKPSPAKAPVQLPLELGPKPKRRPVLLKISPARGSNEPDGVDFVLDEVASHCGVSLDQLMRSMRSHGLIDELGNPTGLGRAFVAFTRRGLRHWRVGRLIRHLSA